MTKKVVPTIIISVLCCLILNGVVFSRATIAGVRPDMIMALTVSLGILIGSTRTQIICGAIGLVLDINAGRFIGMNAAVYVAAGLIAGLFFRKYYTDNFLFPAIVAAGLSLFREIVYALFALFTGAHFNLALMLIAYIVPCALFTGVMTIPIYLIQKPLLEQYGKYIYDKQQSVF